MGFLRSGPRSQGGPCESRFAMETGGWTDVLVRIRHKHTVLMYPLGEEEEREGKREGKGRQRERTNF